MSKPQFLPLILFTLLFSPLITGTLDSFKQLQNLTHGSTLVSTAQVFELGFYTLGESVYLGIWFTVCPEMVVWVANRNYPLNKSSGVLSISSNGILTLYSNNSVIIWSSNSSSTTSPTSVQLLDSGNLVLTDLTTNNLLWQSFDLPTNTLLSGMNFGKKLTTRQNWYLSSYHTYEDPSVGEFRYEADTQGSPEFYLWDGNKIRYRTGPWTGVRFSGIPEKTTYSYLFSFNFTWNQDEVVYVFYNKPDYVSMVVLNETGFVHRLVWDPSALSWRTFWSAPRDPCDYYSECGPYGLCNANDALICDCLYGFVPESASQYMRNTYQGCVRRTKLGCMIGGDGFYKVSGVKLPDTHNATVDRNLSLDECRDKCLQNCSCTAYADVGGSGCVIWTGLLIDTRFIDGGQDLYLRVARSEIGANNERKAHLIIILSTVIAVIIILVFSLSCFIWRKNKRENQKNKTYFRFSKDHELPLFDIETVTSATNNFSIENKIGEGAFGIVYQGQLQNGQEIAVKKLSSESSQGPNEFMNEVLLISKLQHRNLVRLLGCCNDGKERMLIYEYMNNKSLDLILFDEKRRGSLDWKIRLDIILGIARGVLYLHQDSRFNIIHRDLKAANILLDPEMVNYLGYMSPEYAMNGQLSVKSDVYSFGVILLEIISGKRNLGDLNLLAHTWKLWNENKPLELLDPLLNGPCPVSDLLRCIQLALLCVEECPEDRPTMGYAVLMLSSQNQILPEPKKPVICGAHVFKSECGTANGITFTMLEGR